MDDGAPQEFILDPHSVSTESLKNHLRWHQFHIPNLEWMSRIETLAVFSKLAAPRPQRGFKGQQSQAAVEATATMVTATTPTTTVFRKININRKRNGNRTGVPNVVRDPEQPEKPLDVERVTGECKRIRLNGSKTQLAPNDIEMETESGLRMDDAEDHAAWQERRQRRAIITWP